MNARRIVTLGIAGGALAAWLAAAATTGRPPATNAIVRTSSPVEVRGAELSAEIARLRERLHPTVAPQTPARNLFEYSRRTPPPAAVRPPSAPVTPDPAPAPVTMRPTMRLVGIAEDAAPEGAVRTAIISASGQLIFAKIGDRLNDRYQVAKISGEAAELTDLTDNTTLVLVLK